MGIGWGGMRQGCDEGRGVEMFWDGMGECEGMMSWWDEVGM